uniref:RING finger protein 150-like n=1 Tax=Myxine glutinosa TaxID=7769 RepID=UPI00358E4078
MANLGLVCCLCLEVLFLFFTEAIENSKANVTLWRGSGSTVSLVGYYFTRTIDTIEGTPLQYNSNMCKNDSAAHNFTVLLVDNLPNCTFDVILEKEKSIEAAIFLLVDVYKLIRQGQHSHIIVVGVSNFPPNINSFVKARIIRKAASRTQMNPFNVVSIFFFTLSTIMIIVSLSWFLVYYGRRYWRRGASFRQNLALMAKAKRAIAMMDTKTLKAQDLETQSDSEPCSICIECYRAGDVLRILPCRHKYHRHCVDPWLMGHRTCPMCKLNILKALGMKDELDTAQAQQSTESAENTPEEASAETGHMSVSGATASISTIAMAVPLALPENIYTEIDLDTSVNDDAGRATSAEVCRRLEAYARMRV